MSPRRWRRTGVVAAAALVLQGVIATAPVAAQVFQFPVLYVSSNADRSADQPLSGATVTGSIAVFLSKLPETASYQVVSFYIDDIYRTRPPVYTDYAMPWDLLGTPDCADGVPCPLGTARMFDTLPLREGRHSVTAYVETHGNLETIPLVSADFTVRHPASEPPRIYPTTVSGGVPSTTAAAASFLHTGEFPAQAGVAPGTIDSARAAVVRGRVTKRDGTVLPNVGVSVAGHPEYGTTRTRADGWYDLAVNAGVPLTVSLSLTGYVPAERQVDPDPQAWVVADEAALVPYDATPTTVTPSSIPAGDFAVAQAPVVTDDDGSRRSTLLVPSGTTADLVLPNGSHQPASTWTVRQTEFTVGESGERAMPAPLPPTSAYTYAVDLSLDEARAAGAQRTEFSQPLWHYNENFLGFPAVAAVPAGYYDPAKHAWVPSDNGIVLDVVGETAGRADVDVTGDGVADGAAALAAIGLTDDEREQLAGLYDPGESLWRVGITHFSIWDFNWGFWLGLDAIFPVIRGIKGVLQNLLPNCGATGSVIGCEAQSLGESVPVAGTGLDLVYDSHRVPGNRADSALSLLVTPAAPPATLKRVEMLVDVAGRRFTQTVAATPNARFTFDWDGVDAYGRRLNGAQVATVRARYVYDGVYTRTTRFMAAGDGDAIGGSQTRRELFLDRTFTADLMPGVVADSRGLGLGGWMLDAHHTYDGQSRTLAMGDGRVVKVDSLASSITTVAGSGVPGFSGDGGAATAAALDYPGGAAYDAAGNLYVADTFNDRIRKVTPAGVISTVAGTGTFGFAGDGGPATAAGLASPLEMSVGPDGALYVADVDNHRVRRIAPDGTITTVAGSGVRGFAGDGDVATSAQLAEPTGVAVGPDGRLFVADYANHRVRVVTPDGVIVTLAGDGTPGFAGDGGPAADARLNRPSSLAVDGHGAVYVADSGNNRIRRIAPDGTITTVAGTGAAASTGDGGAGTAAALHRPVGVALDADGNLYVAEQLGHRVRQLSPDGSIVTVAGTGTPGSAADEAIAVDELLSRPRGVAVAPDGSVLIVDAANQRVRRVGPAAPRGSVTARLVPSPDNDGTVFEFDTAGRHKRTLDELTGDAVITFAYDSAGRLTTATDRDGNAVTVTRPAASSVVVTSPDGHATQLTLNAAGWAQTIAAPGSLTNAATYTSTGLLQTFTDRNGHQSLYGYDDLGRLSSARGRDLKTTTLTRTELDDGVEIEVATPGGHETVYRLRRGSDGVLVHEVVDPTGIVQRQEQRPDGTSLLTVGTSVLTEVVGPDPRWGMLRPVPVTTTVQAPGRAPVTSTFDRTVTLGSGGLLDVAAVVDTHTVGNRTWTTTYDDSSRTVTSETPGGRSTVTTLDAEGHVVAEQVGDLAPVTYGYDSRGRIESSTQGTGPAARSVAVTYKPNGFVDTVTNPLTQATTYAYDAGLRPSQVTGPRGVLATSHDGNGNATTVTPPGRPAYTIAPSVDDRLDSYTVPNADAAADTVTYDLDDDRRFTGATLPSGTEVAFGFDATGRLETIGYGAATTTFTWTAGRLSSVASPDGVTVTPGYTSGLPTSTTWSGGVTGSVSWTFDDEMRMASQTVGGTPAVTFGRDGDGLLTSAGAETLTRDPDTGAVTATAVGSVGTAATYSTFGEPASFTASYASTALYDVDYTVRDDAGRIVERVETTDGATHGTTYGYDAANRLDTVAVDGTQVAGYDYDAAGNLVAETLPAGTTTSTYDAQDRIATRGPVTYAHDADGQRLSATDGAAVTTYGWANGRLASVALPGGPTVSYQYDGFGNRVARLVDGALVRGYLWHGARLVAETNAAGTVLARFVYGARAHVPDYLVASGVTYRLVTDERGSVRLVVNTTTGAIAQQISYDPWGRVTTDTNPGFQPFGYAGGLADATTGLVRFGVRDYDPVTTQWISRDTIGFAGGTNHYTYADGDPINQIDPTGHSATACFADVLGLAGMIPVIGTAFDIASALLYLSQGKWGDAALAMSGIIIPLSATQLKGIARFGDDALGLADDVVLVRGGTNTAERFANGSGVTSDAAGRLSGVSVNAGQTVEEAAQGIKNNQIGVSTVGDVRKAGGTVTRDPTPNNPNHCLISGCTADDLSALFTPTIPNPWR